MARRIPTPPPVALAARQAPPVDISAPAEWLRERSVSAMVQWDIGEGVEVHIIQDIDRPADIMLKVSGGLVDAGGSADGRVTYWSTTPVVIEMLRQALNRVVHDAKCAGILPSDPPSQ